MTMIFALGYITGLVTAVLIVAVLNLFKVSVEKSINSAEKHLRSIGLKPKGFVYLPESEEEIARKEIIARNKAEGKDTRIKELL